MPEPLLEVRALDAFYGDSQALFGVSLRVGQGEVVAVIGANGAGKSTLLKCIAGAIRSRGDAILLDGQPIGHAPAHAVVARGIALVPEGRRLFPSLSVEENLLIGGQLGRPGPWSLARIYELFPVLAERRHQPSTSLSGGQQQMVAIGRALMARPTLMLLDEPSMGLAPRLVTEIYEIVTRLNREERLAVLLAEQNATMALQVAQHGYVMENGRIVLDGDAKTISQNEDIKEFYLGLTGVGQRKSYRDVKHYRRRKRWLS
jgi:branched-chain amino acid transport system ATP-binding protein